MQFNKKYHLNDQVNLKVKKILVTQLKPTKSFVLSFDSQLNYVFRKIGPLISMVFNFSKHDSFHDEMGKFSHVFFASKKARFSDFLEQMARAEDNYKLYSTNLDSTVDENDLSTEFERFGVDNSVQISRDQSGSATVVYANRRDAKDACRAMDGA